MTIKKITDIPVSSIIIFNKEKYSEYLVTKNKYNHIYGIDLNLDLLNSFNCDAIKFNNDIRKFYLDKEDNFIKEIYSSKIINNKYVKDKLIFNNINIKEDRSKLLAAYKDLYAMYSLGFRYLGVNDEKPLNIRAFLTFPSLQDYTYVDGHYNHFLTEDYDKIKDNWTKALLNIKFNDNVKEYIPLFYLINDKELRKDYFKVIFFKLGEYMIVSIKNLLLYLEENEEFKPEEIIH